MIHVFTLNCMNWMQILRHKCATCSFAWYDPPASIWLHFYGKGIFLVCIFTWWLMISVQSCIPKDIKYSQFFQVGRISIEIIFYIHGWNKCTIDWKITKSSVKLLVLILILIWQRLSWFNIYFIVFLKKTRAVLRILGIILHCKYLFKF